MGEFRDKETGEVVWVESYTLESVTFVREGGIRNSWMLVHFEARFEPVQHPQPGSE